MVVLRILFCLWLVSINSMAYATYTKVSNSGKALPESATLGSGPDEWACTYDSNTKLIWEVKTKDGGLRDQKWTYTWFDSNSPDGSSGTSSGGTCKTSGRCDTEKYTQNINAQGLCGAKDWRMPEIEELRSLVYCSSNSAAISNLGCQGTYQRPTINSQYFPNTPSVWFWSGSVYSGLPEFAWVVGFGAGDDFSSNMNFSLAVRLVRSGPSFDPLVAVINVAPTASFTTNLTSGNAPLTVNLDASTSSDPDGTIATYAWTSNDGTSINNGKTSSVTFNQAGTFTITLTVIDNKDATATATKQVTVQAKPIVNQSPTASFTANPTSGTTPLTVNVNASGSSDPDGRVASYAWSTSEGKTSNDLVSSFVFNQAGTFTISLTVTDDKGATGTTSKQITVQPKPVTPSPQPTNTGAGTGTISGYLSDRCKAYDSVKPVSIHFSGPKTLDQQSDDRGRYFLTLPVGEYQLTIDDPAYTHYSNTVQIKANFQTSTDISLASAGGCTTKDNPATSYKAIIALASGPDIGGQTNFIWRASQDLTEQAYATLRAQGFNDDDIQYLTADDYANVSNPKIDGHLDSTSLQQAITQWAGGVQDVIIYVVSHGGSASLSLNRSQILRADVLNGWLDQLQSKIGGKLTVVLEACYSGSFLDPLKRSSNRIVMSSSDKDQLAQVNDANNVSFSYGFWSKLAKHGRILDAYIDGGLAVANSTTGNTTGYQRALLDSNGDGNYSKEDKLLVQDYCIGGCKPYASDAPVIESVGPAVELNGETNLTVSMQVNSLQPITKAWVNILRPDYRFPNGVAISDLPQVTLSCNATGNCQGTYAQFNKQGNYTLNFYAQDKEGGLATPRSLQLYQAKSSTLANNAVYDAATQVLTIQDVLYNSQHYYAELKNIGNYQFALQKAQPLATAVDTSPATFDGNKVTIPSVLAGGSYYIVELQSSQSVFKLIQATPK